MIYHVSQVIYQMSQVLLHITQLMTPANSVIKVSLLTMPFCFKQCGIVLAILLLIMCNILSRLGCHFLVKSSVISNRRKFVPLASYAFGRAGKFFARLLIVGFTLGSCVTYFVVFADLGSEMISNMIDKTPEEIRNSFSIIIGIFIVLPRGLVRNVNYLYRIYIYTVTFYLSFVIKITVESIFVGDWWGSINSRNCVNYWRSIGIFQCLPIIFMALFCQTHLLEIYATIPTIYVERINNVAGEALNMSTFIYICVGLFGYIGFCNSESLTGNILLSFKPDMPSELIKLGFLLSIVLNFPAIIFSCRESLNSLLFGPAAIYEIFIISLSTFRFRCLTIAIVIISLIISILVPSLEFVISIMGSTIGVTICLIFPTAIFISITNRSNSQRLLAQCVLICGILLMVFGIYTNLYPMEESTNANSINILFNQVSPSLNVTEALHINYNVTNNLTQY